MSLPAYEKYRDTGVEWLAKVPEHWNVKPLKSLCSHNDDVLDEATPPDTPITYVDISSVDAIRGITTREVMHFGSAPSRARRRVQAGDVVISTVRTYLRAIATIGPADSGLIVSTGFAVVRSRGELIPRFLAYLVSANYFVDQVIARSTGVSYPAINAQELVAIPVVIPSAGEQLTIAAFLDRETAKIDELVSEQRLLMELLKEKRQAAISHAITKGLNPHAPTAHSGLEWLGDVPAHWEMKRLKNVAARLQGRLIVQPQLYFADEGVPIVFGYNIKDGLIDEAGLSRVDFETDRKHAHAKARAGDLFTVRLGDPGKTAVVPKSLDGCHFASIMWIHQDERFNSAWLSHCMNSGVVQRQIEAVNYGAAQTQFNIRDAVDFRLPVPPLEEQRQIVAALDRRLDEIDTLSIEAQVGIDLLQERRAALISAAVTGQVDVRHLAQGKAA